MTLYEISSQFTDLLYNEELTDDEIVEQLQKLQLDVEKKVSDGIAVIQELKGTADVMKSEIDRLTQRKKAIENRIERIKNYYLSELSAMDKKKIVTARGTMTIAKCGGKKPMRIDDENLIPQDFKVIRYEVDKEKVRTALESGTDISGVHLEERGTYLKIS